jgi:4-hydroxybenzoate polyprenyltransferase
MSHPAVKTNFLVRLGSFVRFSHTVFALPFALIAMLVAGGGTVAPMVFFWILVSAVAARTLAMCFNRLVDWESDKLNPRTKDRHTLVSRPQAWLLLAACAGVTLAATAKLNTLCFALSPAMIVILCFYSLTKRFTAFSHFFLGLALSVAPVGAWIAVRASLGALPPFILATAVLLWTFGFDLIYSTLDAEFDRRQGLFSFPSRFGVPAALRLAKVLHVLAALSFIWFWKAADLGPGYAAACGVTLLALVWEHRLAANLDAGSINRAFFQINAMVSMTLLAGTLVDFKVWRHFLP